jgi:murein DD-endopeptidase MepM/ murein hydrolase activator NlpD
MVFMGNSGCPRCQRAVALIDGRPFVTANGSVELWHSKCFEQRHVPLVEDVPPVVYGDAPPAKPKSRARFVGSVAGIMVVALVLVGWATAGTPSAAIANIDVSVPEATAMRGAFAAHEIIPPRVQRGATADELAIPTIDAVPLDRIYPSLRGWIHPVSATTEKVPTQWSRRFGSSRQGILRTECGEGHCGMDLDGPRGRPIVAVAAGTIVRREDSELGQDGRSGRYVRIQHDDGTYTAYMHMDEIADGLRVGDRVDAGQYIGTLGATAVFSAPPHLHFSLEVPDRLGVHGDNTQTEYVDSAPFLARARVAPTPDRTAKPAF